MQSVFQVVPQNVCGTNEAHVPAGEVEALLFFSKGAPKLDCRIGNRPLRGPMRPWDVVILPAGADSWWASTPQSADGVFHLHLAQGFVAAHSQENGEAAPDIAPRFGFRDGMLIGLAQMAFADLSGPGAPSRLVWDTYASALALRLLRPGGAPARTPARGGGLAPFQLRRVTDYLHANLAGDVGLAELAHLAGLSSKHFARAFKQSTGLPPHRWLTNERLALARELLAQGDFGIAEIAVFCGFADQSHFTATFRKTVGVTPGAYRREVRR